MTQLASSKRSEGFTLIEVVLVMAIIAVLAAIAFPRYGDALNRYRADAAARRIAADLGFAQSRARSLSTSRAVVFTAAAGTYRLAGETILNNSMDAYLVDLTSAPYSASIATVNFGGSDTVTFNGFGIPSQGGSIQIRAGTITRTISVDADTGTATVQ